MKEKIYISQSTYFPPRSFEFDSKAPPNNLQRSENHRPASLKVTEAFIIFTHSQILLSFSSESSLYCYRLRDDRSGTMEYIWKGRRKEPLVKSTWVAKQEFLLSSSRISTTRVGLHRVNNWGHPFVSGLNGWQWGREYELYNILLHYMAPTLYTILLSRCTNLRQSQNFLLSIIQQRYRLHKV